MAFCCEDCISYVYDSSLAGGHCGIHSCACASDITNQVYLQHPIRMPRRYIDKDNLPVIDSGWLEEDTL